MSVFFELKRIFNQIYLNPVSELLYKMILTYQTTTLSETYQTYRVLLDFVTYTISTKIIGDKSQFLPRCSGISDKTLSWRPLRSRFPLKKIPGTEFLGYLILDFGEVSTHRTFLCTIRYGAVHKVRQHSFAIFEPLSPMSTLFYTYLTSI